MPEPERIVYCAVFLVCVVMLGALNRTLPGRENDCMLEPTSKLCWVLAAGWAGGWLVRELAIRLFSVGL